LNQSGEVCIANIGPKQRQMRLNYGIGGMLIGIVAAIALSLSGAPLWMRGLCFLPFFFGAIGFWQFRDKT
jgi:hypothetical protein